MEIRCPFCKEKQDKPFNRWDNYKHHIKMHATERNHGRVEFVPAAVEYYQTLVAGTKPRTQRKGHSKRAGAHRPRRAAEAHRTI